MPGNSNGGSTWSYTSREAVGVFSDPDGDPLTYSASSANTSVATVSVAGTSLTITEAGVGTSVITVTADDNVADEISDEFTLTVEHVDEIELNSADVQLTLYPNPTNGVLNIEIENAFESELQVDITDITGRSVLQTSYSSFEKTESLDMSGFEPGIYIVNLKLGNAEFITTVVRE